MFLEELLNGRRALRVLDFMPLLFLKGESTGESADKVDRLLDAISLRCLQDWMVGSRGIPFFSGEMLILIAGLLCSLRFIGS